MNKATLLLLAVLSLSLTGCIDSPRQLNTQQVSNAPRLSEVAAYTVDGDYLRVLSQIEVKMNACGPYEGSPMTFVDTGKSEANYVRNDPQNTVLFRVNLRQTGKQVSVRVYAPQNNPAWAPAIEAARRGALNEPNCPTK